MQACSQVVITDTERLDWLVSHEARVAPWQGGGYRCCRNWEGRLRWYGHPAPNPRAAIDNAISRDLEEGCANGH
jgi:hypothetical protein